MPDNSASLVSRDVFRGLRPGRPHSLKPQVPYRIEEWGKARTYILPEGRDGTKIVKRGPPPCGTIALYVAEETKLPVKASDRFTVRVVEEGFAYSPKDASDRADTYIRRRLIERIGRARRRAARD